ncbi:MAG: GIY-YIG nuclease family protein, partial [Chlamydiales bacterium]
MKNKEEKILYIGKAKNLKTRVKQYFTPGRDGRTMVPFLAVQVEEIETIIVSSEKEALLLENNLIKKHQPKYNALLKDDKSYFSLVINYKHKWP